MSATEPIIEDEVPSWTLGDRIAKAREHAGLEQAELAAKVGVSPAAVSSWENDTRRPRKFLDTVRRISEATGVLEGWLLGVDARSRCFSLVPPVDGQLELDLSEPRGTLALVPAP